MKNRTANPKVGARQAPATAGESASGSRTVDGPREIVTRAKALASGLNKYFTGRPCFRGHIAERYTVKCDCVTCVAQKVRAAKPPKTSVPRHLPRLLAGLDVERVLELRRRGLTVGDIADQFFGSKEIIAGITAVQLLLDQHPRRIRFRAADTLVSRVAEAA
jgi:hypothetical protein